MGNKIIHERCKLAIDIEEIIAMQNEKECQYIRAVATYQSGITEEVHGKLTKGNVGTASFQKKVAALRKFPTVVKVEITKY